MATCDACNSTILFGGKKDANGRLWFENITFDDSAFNLHIPDSDAAGPADLVAAIRARRPGGKLLNLDRMLLNSPAFAQGWNTMFGNIRGKLAVPGKLRETAIMSIGVLNKAGYEWFQHEGDYLKAGGTKEQLAAMTTSS